MPQPIGFPEINAYATGMMRPLSVWERRLIRKMDDAVLAVLRKHQADKRPSTNTEKPARIPMTDAKGVSSLMGALKAIKNRKKGG